MKEKIIIAIVGVSGSGKTTLAKHIAEKLGVPQIVSYTTRAMRNGEVDGVEHWFVTPDQMPHTEDMLAYTQFGKHHYWATYKQLQTSDRWLYVIDERGLVELKEKSKGKFRVASVYINRPVEHILQQVDSSRVDRDKTREPIPTSDYTFIIENCGGMEDFLEIGELVIKEILNNKKLWSK